MRTDTAVPVRLSDYRPPDYAVSTVELHVGLHPTATQVRNSTAYHPAVGGQNNAPLILDGDGLVLVSVKLDGESLAGTAYEATPDRFVLHHPPRKPFTLTIETLVNPTANTTLMGLYRTASSYSTQCEAEGFRRITYFQDRPDVLAVYTVELEGDETETPILLANGNKIAERRSGNGRHSVIWHDPHPKPSYLFAMVAGDLAVRKDHFVTMSGRVVALEIYVEHGKEDRCGYAMEALKRSMRWDETAFGREYDLDIFMIVAVSDFNMGAMENKGLNIFNDKYVLASPETATDIDYANIEAIIAHEYFHNWTGNRITCRDWFQLCLKEGLTVFRDQEFSSDMRSRPVKRITDVRNLRAHQFVEDSGPLAHPVRPEIYHEINNFYTATVYEKGAEVIRMLKILIGEQAFANGMDLYFDRHDGEAATIEQFIACFAEASGRDLSQFMRWYSQSGTPRVTAKHAHDAQTKTWTLDLTQSVPPTPGQPLKLPMVLPIRLGLVGTHGDVTPRSVNAEAFTGVVELRDVHQRFVFDGVDQAVTPSLLRGFSAPVNLDIDLSVDELLLLSQRDSDPFNRWQAHQSVATGVLRAAVANPDTPIDLRFVEAVGRLLDDASNDPAFFALTLALPSESDLARDLAVDVDPERIFKARRAVRMGLSKALNGKLLATVEQMADGAGAFSPDAVPAGRRALANAALELACAAGGEPLGLAEARFLSATNMTDRLAALSILSQHDGSARESALGAFYDRFRDDPLVIDKWFSVQAQMPGAETLGRVRSLMEHPAFTLGNPNRVRALVGAFAQSNQNEFNRVNGEGYRFLAEFCMGIDARNPQLAARLLGAFKSWRSLEPVRRSLAEAALQKIASASCSRDVADIVTRALA